MSTVRRCPNLSFSGLFDVILSALYCFWFPVYGRIFPWQDMMRCILCQILHSCTAYVRYIIRIFCIVPLGPQVVADAHKEWLQSLCCRFLCTNNCSKPALERWEHRLNYATLVVYVFSNSSGFFSCHLSVSAIGPNLLLYGSCKCRSQVSYRYCGSSCSSRVQHILHQASRIPRRQEPFWSSPETPANHAPIPGNRTRYDLSPLYVSNYVQFDEFTPRVGAFLGNLPLCIPVYGNPGGIAWQWSVCVGSGMLFYYLVQPRLNDSGLEKSGWASVVIHDILVLFPALAVLQQRVYPENQLSGFHGRIFQYCRSACDCWLQLMVAAKRAVVVVVAVIIDSGFIDHRSLVQIF